MDMSQISLRRDLELRGISRDEIRALVRNGKVERVRRGAYATAPSTDQPARSAVARRHRLLVQATARQLSEDLVFSHMSAALLLGLPTWNSGLLRAQLTSGRSGGGKTRRDVMIHGLPLDADEVVTVDGYRVTSRARTVLDLGCTLELDRAVAVGDAALRQGLEPEELASVVARGKGRTGIGRARTAAGMADPRSESPGESVSRVTFIVRGLPVPDVQYEVYAPDGTLTGRSDVAWPEFRTLGEFDGRIKYQGVLRPGQRAEDVVFAEKLREDRLRDLGWEVVRWTWDDLQRPEELIRRIEAAFQRGLRRPQPPDFRRPTAVRPA